MHHYTFRPDKNVAKRVVEDGHPPEDSGSRAPKAFLAAPGLPARDRSTGVETAGHPAGV